jgi:hypothetical protein
MGRREASKWQSRESAQPRHLCGFSSDVGRPIAPDRQHLSGYQGHIRSVSGLSGQQKRYFSCRYFAPRFPAYDFRPGRTRYRCYWPPTLLVMVAAPAVVMSKNSTRAVVGNPRAPMTSSAAAGTVLRLAPGDESDAIAQVVDLMAGPSCTQIVRGETWRLVSPAKTSRLLACIACECLVTRLVMTLVMDDPTL